MKNKVKIITKEDLSTWIHTANYFAKSYESLEDVLSEFNCCPSHIRKGIRKTMAVFDDSRRKMIPTNLPKEELKQAYETSVFVDLNIVAAELNLNPLTVALCIKPPCKDNERVVVKY